MQNPFTLGERKKKRKEPLFDDPGSLFGTVRDKIRDKISAAKDLNTPNGRELGISRLSARGTGAKVKLAGDIKTSATIQGSVSDGLKKGRGRVTPRSSRGLQRGGKVGGL